MLRIILLLGLAPLMVVRSFKNPSYEDEKPGKKCAMTNLAPLYRAANNNKYAGSQIHHTSFGIFVGLVNSYAYTEQLAVVGQVATSNDGCNGQLKPVTRLVQPWILDRVMTADKDAVEGHKAAGYNHEGIAFYCSAAKQEDCGATVPFHCFTYTGKTDGKPRHTCHTDLEEAKATIAVSGSGGKYDGILCYIWPPQSEAVKQI